MRKLLLLFQPATVCLLAACAFHSDKDWLRDIAGSYVTHYQQPYGAGWDTLVIQRQGNDKSKLFRIQRRTGYQRISNGEKGPTVLKVTIRQVVAEPSSLSLIHSASGIRYGYDPATGEIRTGNVIYYKIK